jgi:hypothetical protein
MQANGLLTGPDEMAEAQAVVFPYELSTEKDNRRSACAEADRTDKWLRAARVSPSAMVSECARFQIVDIPCERAIEALTRLGVRRFLTQPHSDLTRMDWQQPLN